MRAAQRPTPRMRGPVAVLATLALLTGSVIGQASQEAADRPLLLRVSIRPAQDATDAELRRGLEASARALEDTLTVEIETEAPGDPDQRLRFELLQGARRLVAGAERSNGLARCRIESLDSGPAPLEGLVQRFGYEARTGWLSIDVPAVTGNLAAMPRDGGPLDEALTLASLACGELALFARPTEDRRGWQLTARSDAGLLLPALLMLLSDAAHDDPAAGALGDDLDRWLLIARAARAEEREEALRQLSRFPDPRAVDVLERTLFDPELRDVAALALAHLGTPEAVAALSRHAQHLDPELVADGVWTALPAEVQEHLAERIVRAGDRSDAPLGPV